MPQPANGQVNSRNLLTVISALVLVGVELFGAALAAGWAIAGLFQLGNAVGYALMAIFCIAAAYGLYLFALRAISVEPIRT